MTIYDIAKEAGVAASTVSRVINEKPGIKAETRERIKELLVKYNYTPNEAARGLVTQSSRIIGILIEDIRVIHHTESAYVIEQEMTRQGYCCITMSTGPTDEKKMEYIRILEQRRVEGVILIGSMLAVEAVKKSIEEHLKDIPVVILNGNLELPNVYGVLVDEEGGMRECVRLMAGKGRKKLAFVRDTDSPSNRNKERGFLAGMTELGWNESEAWVYRQPELRDGEKKTEKTTKDSLEDGYRMTLRVLEEHPEVEGIIYSIDLQAVGGMRALTDRGIDIPGQIAVIGVDNTIYGEICSPRLTTLNNKLEEVSETASRILLDVLSEGKSPHKMMLFSEIIEREST